jgi:glucosamine kinase
VDFFIGVDGGGTHCRAILFNEAGDTLGVGNAGGANVFTDFTMSMQQIDIAIDEAMTNAIVNATDDAVNYSSNAAVSDKSKASLKGLVKSQLIVGAGCAGGQTSEAKERLLSWTHPYKCFFMTSDLHASCLAAHQGQDCVVIITGTGSSVAHYRQGQVSQYGGHGFIHGDDASGAWLGLNAIRLLLKSYDGLLQDDVFCNAIMNAIGCCSIDQVLGDFKQKSASDYALLAPHILSLSGAGNKTAATLVQEGVDYLSSILIKNNLINSSRIFITGGLAEAYKSQLSQKIACRIDTMDSLAQVGAFLYAKIEYQSS